MEDAGIIEDDILPPSVLSSLGVSRSPSPQVSNAEKAATTSLLPKSAQVILEDQDAAMLSLAATEAIVRGEDMPLILEQVGLPLDGRWDHDAAYDKRYCFQHGEDEFLLGTPSRWMRPTDFKLPAVEDRLKSMFEQFSERPSAFNPHSRRHQAECTSRLWSHVESVIGRSTLDDQVLYLIRWKACWTPRSCIDDGDWLGASLRVNRNPQCQRSSRLGQTAEARRKTNDEIMRVVRLD